MRWRGVILVTLFVEFSDPTGVPGGSMTDGHTYGPSLDGQSSAGRANRHRRAVLSAAGDSRGPVRGRARDRKRPARNASGSWTVVVAPAMPGPNAGEATRLFYKQMALRRGLPFDVTITKTATRLAMRDVERGRDLTRTRDTDERSHVRGL
jgi:hypothetical protein